MSNRYVAAINKPGFNPLGTQTTTTLYNLYSWGGNNYGQLGLGNRTSYSSPMQVGSLTDWYYVLSAGYDAFEMSIKKDGTLWTWGQNTYGELALNNRTQYSSPKQVGALTNWLQVASGGYGILAIKTDGTLWGWGNPSVYGSLGLGNTSYYSSPKQVGSLTNWKTISKSYFYFSLAIKTDGTLWSWGYNGYGQLGIGNLTNYSSPKQVGALTTWSSVTAGYNQTLAIKTDGTLWGWGSNAYGQIGDGTRTSKSSPVQIGALTTWLSVSGGGYFSVALKTDGTLWSWGYNATGSLGLGNTTYYSSPKQVGSLTTWSKLNTNSNSGLVAAIKTDGTLWTWGNNAQGQLGLGNRTNYSSPKQVGSLTTWLSVSCGVYTIIALG